VFLFILLMNKNSYYPLVEKYRPSNFDNIVLDYTNKQILTNIIETSNFPNILFYGPPGTGKTTTILNLIQSYQERLGINGKGLTIHLNASDERGIETIRTQINSFVKSNTLFDKGMKFVILDEVDYMTKTAQQALKYVLQSHSTTVRFCLICNYISKIDEGLQAEFVILRFNQLPEEEILKFLETIVETEHINISTSSLVHIQQLYKSDMRSMINCIQTYQNASSDLNIITNDFIEKLYSMIIEQHPTEKIIELIESVNQDAKNVLKYFFNYVIKTKSDIPLVPFLQLVKNIVHFPDGTPKCILMYCIAKMKYIFSTPAMCL
jgi:DNA polymerase III delta prime subunit